MKKVLFILSLIFFINSTNGKAQQALHLIPTPHRLKIKQGHFELKNKLSIHENGFNSEILKDFIHQELGIEVIITKNSMKSDIDFHRIDSLSKLKKKLQEEGLNGSFMPGNEAYVLDISEKGIHIYSTTDHGIFYAVQTLKQLISGNRNGNKIPACTIYDFPSIAIRAWQDDISRGPIPTMEMLKKQIETLASFKLNYFTLYTEHVFKLKKYPDIAPNDGITAGQINELTEFAKKNHIQLIGNYQSFGHMEKTLSKPAYSHLAESGHIISPSKEESYQFLSNVFSEIAQSYKGEYFNINCDETFGLGEGQSKAMLDSMGLAGVYAYHINRLNDLLKPYGKKIVMWGDIAASHAEIVKKLPKDITVVVWAYHPAESFDYTIKPISESGLNFWVAPGINCWSNIYPNFKATKINVYNFIRDGIKLGATGILNTSWDDDGSNFSNNNRHGFAWGAELSWNAPDTSVSKNESDKIMESRYQLFNQSFDRIYYGLSEKSITNLLIQFAGLHDSSVRDIQKNSNFFEPIFPIYNEFVQESVIEDNLKVQKQLDSLSFALDDMKAELKTNKQTIDFLAFAIEQLKFSITKNLFRAELYYYIKGTGKSSEKELKTKIGQLLSKIQQLKESYKTLWKLENRDWWLSNNMERFKRLENDIINLNKYCLIQPDSMLNEKGRKITLQSLFDNQQVYYTLDGTEPGLKSLKYQAPFFVDKNVKISARVIENGEEFIVSNDSFVFHKAIGKLHKLNCQYSPYHPAYDGGGSLGLLDGRTGSPEDIRNTRWQGYSGQNIDIEIDMEKMEELHSFSMGYFQNTYSWVILPKRVEIYISEDGTDYQLIKTINHNISPKLEGSLKHEFQTDFNNLKTRYLKIVGVYFGNLPEWHHAAGNESMLFADEIIVK